MTVVNFTTPGAATWLCPAGVTHVAVQGVGGGGAGGAGLVGSVSGAGGGGGAFALTNSLAVTPGVTYNLNVGAGGAGTNAVGGDGTDSWFNTSSIFKAVAGTGGQDLFSGGTQGSGGLAGNCISANGSTSGGDGGVNITGDTGGSGGGASGSLSGAGGSGNEGVSGAGTGGAAADGTGGNGGDGAATNAGAGNAGSTPGGGGGGASGAANGGNGATGIITLTFTAVTGKVFRAAAMDGLGGGGQPMMNPLK